MKNKILVYDDQCTLCTWYSGLFVRYGFLSKEGRKPFSTLEPFLLQKIDFSRGRNEIPFLDTVTGRTIYGIDAMLEIFGSRLPWITRIGNLPMINWILKKCYKLISYNRKLIIAKKCGTGVIDCAPDLNYFYRGLFMLIFLAFNTWMLFPIHANLLTRLPYYNLSIMELQAAHLGLVVINILLTLRFKRTKTFEYLGQVNILALITVLLLTIPLLISFLQLPSWLISGYLIFTTIIVFKEYLRRMDYAGILQSNRWLVSINLVSLVGFILILFG